MHINARRLGIASSISLIVLLAVAVSASAATRALFSSQQFGSSGLTQYSINLDTGDLTQQGPVVSSGSVPTVPGISANGSRIYVGAFNDDAVHGFSIGSGGLTALPSSPYATGDGPNEVVLGPYNNSAWTANSNGGTISGLSADSAGSLTEIGGSPYPSGLGTNALAVSAQSTYTYATNYFGDTLGGFQITSNPGLTTISGFPMVHPNTPCDVEFSVAADLLFVCNNATDNVSMYSVDRSTGSLDEVSLSPFAAGDGPAALAASPDGKFLFVLNNTDQTIQSYLINTTLNMLTPAGGPISTGNNPYDLTITPDSRFIYAANYNDGTISGYAINATGGLTELSGSPYGDASGPVVSFAIVPDQGPVAKISASTIDSTTAFDASGSYDPDGTVALYNWTFGDGTTAQTTSPTTTHTYEFPGQYQPSVRVVDNENCSTEQIGTGQTIACNGSVQASAGTVVTALLPLTLKHATGKQLKSKKVKGKLQKRVQTEFFLSRAANVSYQFQKSSSKGRCRTSPTKKKGKAKYKNFGKKASYPGNSGRVRRIFTGKFGGKTIVPGRYRVQLKATAPDSFATPSVTSASFCVR